MRVLVACEYSGRVREAFRRRGHEAYSFDLLPSEDNSPFHIQDDVLKTLDHGWDLLIAHPPCTYLTNSGVRWLHDADSTTEPLKGRPRWDAAQVGHAGAQSLVGCASRLAGPRSLEGSQSHVPRRRRRYGGSVGLM